MLVVPTNHLNYPKDNIFEGFFKKYNRLFVFIIYNDENPKA